MPVNVIDTIKPKNNGSFPVVEAADVAVSADLRLPAALAEKANAFDVAETTEGLQAQIDQIAQAAGTGTAETEVAQARVGYDGQTYSTLKARLDAEIVGLESDMQAVGIAASHFAMDASTAHSSSANKVKKTVHTNDTIIVSVSADTELSGSVMYDVFGYVGNTGTKISSGYVNGSKIKVKVENNYEAFGAYVRSLGSAANVEFSVESETSFVTKCQVVEKKDFNRLTPLILGHNAPYKIEFSATNKTMTIPKDTIAFVVSDIGNRQWVSLATSEAAVIDLDIGTSAFSVYFDTVNSSFSVKAYNATLSNDFIKNNILIANVRLAADGMVLPSLTCDYKIAEDVPAPFIYGYGVMIPSGTGAYPEIDTIEKTVFIPNDTLILDNRLPNKYLSLQAATVSFDSIATGALVVYYDITNEAVSIAAYSSSAFRSDDEIVLFTFRKSKKIVCSTIPIFVDGKLFGIIDTSKEVKSSFVRGINHRGYNTIAPENTIPAYKLSKQYGFDTVETDVEWTSDEVPVLLHDSTIDRTSDGEGNVGDFTYDELLEFDFGSWKSAAYTGTKIPTFDEFMKLCRNLGLCAYAEIKGDQTSERISILYGIVKKYHMEKNVSWISSSRTSLSRILSVCPSARIGIAQTLTTSDLIQDAVNLKSESNTVFIDVQAITDEQIETCIQNEIDVEMWTVNSADTMLSANGYISGFTSDSVNAKEVFSDVSNN